MKFKSGDRVIYDGCPFIIEKCNKSKGGWLHNREDIDESYLLYPLKWDKDYPYPNTWISNELIKPDNQYNRNEIINSLLNN